MSQPPRPPYAGNPYARLFPAAAPAYRYAGWGRRVAATLIDGVLGLAASVPLIAGYAWVLASLEIRTDGNTGGTSSQYTGGPGPVVLVALGVLVTLAFWIWNTCVRQGRTGATLGKSHLGIRVVKESTGRPIGAGQTFVRCLAHYVDSLVCYLGWLWPLWDEKRQTIGDKIMSTVVVRD
ncbi:MULTISPECIES: RDD family protein [unclassified Nocardioides]|uniref:RDD family protein n=1 Tax=unclassified Nocardioides TaxID=2615069 RepID=UPI0030153F1C